MARERSDGLATMRALAVALPAALEDGFARGRELSLPAESGPAEVYVAGMGGSGIAGELARGIVESETPVQLIPVRQPTSPPSFSSRSRVLLISYSGSTWETLRAYEAAGRARAYRLVITSGGPLAEAAGRDRVPVLPLPSGLPPRASVGYALGGILGVLDPWFPESNDARLRRILARIPSAIASMARSRGPADRLASAVGDRFPFVYAESSFLGLARRWKTQVEENAKQLAAFDEMPELFHNALVAWDALGPKGGDRFAPILLDWDGSPPLVRQGLAYLERLVKSRGAAVQRVRLEREDRLEALLEGLAMGDHFSLFLAARRGVDPLPFEAITRLKAALGPAEALSPAAPVPRRSVRLRSP